MSKTLENQAKKAKLSKRVEQILPDLLPLISRIFISGVFILSAFGQIYAFLGTRVFMIIKGIPFSSFTLVVALVFEILGGLSLLLGFRVKWGIWLLIIFIIPVSFIFHTKTLNPLEMMHMMKNIAIIGGLLTFVYYKPGKYSLDYLFEQKKAKKRLELEKNKKQEHENTDNKLNPKENLTLVSTTTSTKNDLQ